MIGMCDSARCPQATHHQHPPARLGRARRTDQDLPRPTRQDPHHRTAPACKADYDRALRVITTSTRPPNQRNRGTGMRISCRPTSSRTRTASAPPWTGCCAARSRPAATAISRPSHSRPGRPHRLLRHPAYAHLRAEFEHRLARIREAGDPIGSSEGQISRLKDENAKLKARLAQSNSEIGDLTDFRTTALARLAAQHEEIIRLRSLVTTPRSNITRLPGPRQKIIGPC